MKIGLLSDSHGRVDVTRRAVETLLAAGAQALIHLGDIGGVEVIDTLVGLTPHEGLGRDQAADRVDGRIKESSQQRLNPPLDVHLVFGNTDHDLAAMPRHARSLGIKVDHPAGGLDLDDGPDNTDISETSRPDRRKLVFLHGHDHGAMARALEDKVSYLCHGHTHERRDDRVGFTRVINPGALCRASVYSVALLETREDRLTFYVIA